MSDSRFDIEEGENGVERLRAFIATEQARGIHASQSDINKAQFRLRALGATVAAAADAPGQGQ
jgi:hypothetical protein